mmetsp:Transcript_36080/g.102144  ORF Transcript_36080/g.102144 Transcript_36080/m.102144 type:complete len:153 (+) Transcript_36080:169-627(+)
MLPCPNSLPKSPACRLSMALPGLEMANEFWFPPIPSFGREAAISRAAARLAAALLLGVARRWTSLVCETEGAPPLQPPSTALAVVRTTEHPSIALTRTKRCALERALPPKLAQQGSSPDKLHEGRGKDRPPLAKGGPRHGYMSVLMGRWPGG